MIRFLLLIAIVFAGIWVYNNVDFEQLGNSTVNTLKKEKTINKFNSADQMNKDAVNDALNY